VVRINAQPVKAFMMNLVLTRDRPNKEIVDKSVRYPQSAAIAHLTVTTSPSAFPEPTPINFIRT